ncbi:MAG: peptidylprolyl isomerase [Nanoarchaeota archaeon]|nr:peptidylprolyl isomerase [Nanoarchaeota archaeon]
MVKIQEKDFIELDFTGKIKETGEVFDTTLKSVATKNKLNDKATYKPALVCIGQGTIFAKLEQGLIGKELDKEYTIELNAEEGFGKKNAKLIQLMPTSVFKKEKINPQVGLFVTINDKMGIIRTINGGRCLVDFNHPLSGKDLVYEIKPLRQITDKKEQINHLITAELRIDNYKLTGKEGEFLISFENKISKLLTEAMRTVLIKNVKDLTGETVKIK